MKPSLIPSRAHKRILATSATSLLAGLLSAHGQIVLNGVGAPVVETFTAAPLATSWSRSDALFGTASATISNDLTADNRVNGVTGTGVTIANTTTVLGPGGAALTATNNYFQHFTNGYVGAASTGVDGSVLMARLSNNTGSPISTLNLSWDLTLFNNSVATPETTPGHRLYWSLNGTAWNAVGNFGFIGVAGAAATRTVAQSTNIPFANWAAGTSAYLVWLDDNGLTNPDGLYALDNVSFTGVAGRTFIYNLTHGEAGAPNGALATTGNYFLEGGNPATFAAGQFAKFSQAGDATVDVPANISVGALQVTAPSGTYTIGGTGQIAGALEKSGAGTLALTSANAFVSTSLNGGNIRLSAAGALGTGGVALGASGGTLDTSINYTLNNIISGTGPLTKTGTGTLTLGGVNTHTNTTISTGAAVLSGSLATNHTLGVSSGATLTVTGSVGTGSTTTIGGRLLGTGTVNGTTTISNAATVESGALGVGTLTFQNLAFGTIAGNTANFSASLASKINVTGTFLINGGANSVTINIAGSPSGALPQTYTLIDYATIGGTGFTGFVLGTQPNRAVASLVNNTVDGRVDYTITAVDFPVWKGAVSGNWALGSQGGAENWVLNSNNATSTTFQVADNVHFDDVAGAPQTVAINGADVAVSSVTFSNNAHNYTFTGTHGISGNAPLVKSGTGTVTFNNTNSFTGGVAISAGTIQAAILANDGANSSLGSGASFALDGGATFEYTGAAPGATNRIITANNAVGAGGGTIRTSQNLTLSGAISGAGTLNKAGAGRVIIASTMTGASTVAEGVLEFGAGANFTGTTVNAAEIDIADGSAVAGTITNNNTLRITRNTAGTITSTIGGTGELTMSGLGSVTLGGAAANTFTGITRVLAGVLIAGKTAGTNAIGGNLLIDGGSFQYSAAGTQNEIPDTANITLNSGSFGDALNAGPLAQQTDVVNNVTVNGGTFGSLRSGTSAPFQVNGTLSVGATGAVLLQRGGGLSANTVSIAAGGVVNFDGGSTTGATAPLVQDSRLLVGAGGLTVTDGNFNFNAGPSGLGATSKGSRLQLNGTFTSSGTTNILRAAASLATVPQARSAIELNSGVRTFDVTGTLNLGTTAAPLSVRDGNPPVDAADTTPVPAPGGIAKNGTGILHLPGNQPYTGTTTINGGTLAIDGTLSTSSVAIRAGGTLTGQGSTVGGVTVETGGSIVAGVSGSGALSFPTLTLGTSAGDISSLSIARNGATPAIINVTGTNGLIANGGANSVTVNFGGPNPGVGQYVLIDYAGNLGGGLTAFKTGTLPNRVQTAVLEDDTVNTTIVLNISAIEVPIWTGKTSPEWSTATLAAPKNWGIVGSASTTDFLNQDNVLFDDSAQTTALEISNGDISPSAVRFNNATKSYTLTGPNVITGPATFTKDGAASVTISGANSFTGSVSLNAGTTIVDTVDNTGIAQPLGTSASLTFNGGTLQYNGFAGNTNRALALQGAGTVKTDTSLTLNGLITGTGRLTKSGTGTLILSAANTNFDGGLTIGGGTVQFAAVDGVGGATQIVTLDGGTLEYTAAATLDWAGAAVTRGIASASGGAIRVTAGAAGNGLVLTRAGSLTGAGLIAKDGIGTLRIVADNVGYTGDWRINQGAIEIQSANSLGNGKVAVETGGILVAQSKAAPNTYIVPNDVTLNGGTLQTRSGNLTTYGGNVHVTAPSFTYQRSFTTITASQDITISGPLSGNQPLTIQGNADNTATALILTNPASTFSGQYIVTPSQGLTAHPAITGNPLGTGSISLDSARLGLLDDGTGNGGTVVYGNPVTIGATGATTFNVNRSTAASLPVGNNNTIQLGALTSAAATLNVTGGNGYTVEFNGISNIGATPTINTTTGSLGFRGDVTSTGPLVKTGAGTLHLNGTGTANVTGGVDVQAGTLNVNSTLTSTLDVNIGGTLSGSGTITNNVTTTATGTIAPGNSAGILSLGSSVSFAAGSSFNVELTHISPGGAVIAGTDYDQLNVGTGVLDGTVNIAGANLNLTTGIGFLSTDLFFILLNDGVDAVTGTFANIPAAGTQFTVGGFQFEISYDADAGTGSLHGGNDIALLVPEPGSAALLLGGLAILAGRRRRNVN